MPQGLLLTEASHGNLQQYIDKNDRFITPSLRKKWCLRSRDTHKVLGGAIESGVIAKFPQTRTKTKSGVVSITP